MSVSIEHLNEPAHVRALELLGQVHIHADGGDCVLDLMRLVEDSHREPEPADTDLVNWQLAVVGFGLFVVQSSLPHPQGLPAVGEPPRRQDTGPKLAERRAADKPFKDANRF
jgi:hypothetical protein